MGIASIDMSTNVSVKTCLSLLNRHSTQPHQSAIDQEDDILVEHPPMSASMLTVIIHQIFSLARDWSNHVT